MLRKIEKIENTGKLRACTSKGDAQFKENTMIFGTNGDGKSTLCAVLRSLSENEPAYLKGRKTLGQENDPEIVIRCESGGSARFINGEWRDEKPKIAIYDEAFIEENIYSGNAVDTEQKRSLYHVIIGKEGVTLAQNEASLTQEVKDLTASSKNKGREITAHIPEGIVLKDFLTLEKDDDIEGKIDAQKKKLASVQQAAQVKAKDNFEKLPDLTIPDDLEALLGKTLDDVAADAEAKIAAQITKHKMEEKGERWLQYGTEHIEEDCPYCGQDITDNDQVAAYKAVFSNTYKGLKDEISELKTSLEQHFDALSERTLTVQKNKTQKEFWKQFVDIEDGALTLEDAIADKVGSIGQKFIAHLNQKIAAPLETIPLSEELKTALKSYEDNEKESVTAYNKKVQALNDEIKTIKENVSEGNTGTETAALNQLLAIQKRYEISIDELCKEYQELLADLKTKTVEKDKAREDLEAYTNEVMPKFEARINELLDDFNATFKIVQTSHTFAGGKAATNYQLSINDVSVDIGRADSPMDQPSFKNTLSGGDKSILALAFFLVALENDPDKAETVAAFDDPFTSQDKFRRENTIYEIRRVQRECAQVIVLSHDQSFLKDYWGKCDAAERKSIKFHNQGETAGSIIMECDIEELCRARTETERQKLRAFYHENVGDEYDVIQKMRVVLESYFRATYPSSFNPADNLGDICRKIREAGQDGPAWCHYGRVERINDYSSTFHHGDDPTQIDSTEEVDRAELKGYVQWTLKILNAL